MPILKAVITYFMLKYLPACSTFLFSHDSEKIYEFTLKKKKKSLYFPPSLGTPLRMPYYNFGSTAGFIILNTLCQLSCLQEDKVQLFRALL